MQLAKTQLLFVLTGLLFQMQGCGDTATTAAPGGTTAAPASNATTTTAAATTTAAPSSNNSGNTTTPTPTTTTAAAVYEATPVVQASISHAQDGWPAVKTALATYLSIAETHIQILTDATPSLDGARRLVVTTEFICVPTDRNASGLADIATKLGNLTNSTDCMTTLSVACSVSNVTQNATGISIKTSLLTTTAASTTAANTTAASTTAAASNGTDNSTNGADNSTNGTNGTDSSTNGTNSSNNTTLIL